LENSQISAVQDRREMEQIFSSPERLSAPHCITTASGMNNSMIFCMMGWNTDLCHRHRNRKVATETISGEDLISASWEVCKQEWNHEPIFTCTLLFAMDKQDIIRRAVGTREVVVGWGLFT